MSLEKFNKILYSRARKKCVAAVAYVVDYPTDVAAVKKNCHRLHCQVRAVMPVSFLGL